MAENSDDSNVEKLREAGNKLLQPISSLEELLDTLDRVATYLYAMEQSSAEIVEATLSPLPKALVANELLLHPDLDVNVNLATCLCEIMRISAPDSLYDDDKLKVVFQSIVHSFEDLYDPSNRWFGRRIQNLETMARIRLGLVMLDSNCQDEIAELFDIFLVVIREDHPETVFSYMETIMIDTINSTYDEEDIHVDVIVSLLGSLQKEDREVGLISGNLAESVIQNCSNKLRPYIWKTIESLGTSLDDYFSVVSSVFEGVPLATMD